LSAFTKAPFGVVAPFLADYGYHPVPIIPGDKRPAVDEWQTPRPPAAYLPRYARYWTGILTATCPAIDLDIRDKELVRVLIDTAGDMLGVAPFRVGQPPKALLLYGADAPFPKITGRWWALPGEDIKAERYNGHRVEILGDGNQFVAFAKHPRGTFYRWQRYSPMSLHRDVLVPIGQGEAQAFLETAERIIAKVGGRPIKRRAGVWEYDDVAPQRPARPRDHSREWAPSEWQKMDPEALAKRIDPQHAKRTRQGWICSCPAHKSEGNRSLTVNYRADGGSLVKCWAECDFADIARAIEHIVGRAA
jgi:hypothetical protein